MNKKSIFSFITALILAFSMQSGIYAEKETEKETTSKKTETVDDKDKKTSKDDDDDDKKSKKKTTMKMKSTKMANSAKCIPIIIFWQTFQAEKCLK